MYVFGQYMTDLVYASVIKLNYFTAVCKLSADSYTSRLCLKARELIYMLIFVLNCSNLFSIAKVIRGGGRKGNGPRPCESQATKSKMSFSTPTFFRRFVNAQVYFGVSLGSVLLGGNMYLNFFLTSLIELPGNAFAIWSMDR